MRRFTPVHFLSARCKLRVSTMPGTPATETQEDRLSLGNKRHIPLRRADWYQVLALFCLDNADCRIHRACRLREQRFSRENSVLKLAPQCVRKRALLNGRLFRDRLPLCRAFPCADVKVEGEGRGDKQGTGQQQHVSFIALVWARPPCNKSGIDV